MGIIALPLGTIPAFVRECSQLQRASMESETATVMQEAEYATDFFFIFLLAIQLEDIQ